MSYTLARKGINGDNEVTLGTVTSERWNSIAGLIVLPFPQEGSEEADVYDYMGVTTEISLTGVYIGTRLQINTFISYFTSFDNTVRCFLDGKQLNSVTGDTSFYSEQKDYTYNVKVQNFDWDVEFGQDFNSNAIKINYTLKLVICSDRG